MTALTPDELAEIRARDERFPLVNGIGSPITVRLDRRSLLSHIDDLTAEVERAQDRVRQMRDALDAYDYSELSLPACMNVLRTFTDGGAS